MADSYHYTTVTYNPGTDFNTFDLLNQIGIFLRDTVGNGWQYLHYTGQHQGVWDGAVYDYAVYAPNDNPFKNAQDAGAASGSGVHPVVNPNDGDYDRSQTIYLRWSDGSSEVWENYFFITTLAQAGSGSIQFNDIRTGYLDEPYVTPIENLKLWQMSWDQDAGIWTGTAPSEDPADYGYASWPTSGSSEAAPTRDTNSYPTSYVNQPGYITDTVTDHLLTGTAESSDPNVQVVCHLFGGVSDGAPFFYCTIESGQREVGVSELYFTHFGIGRVTKVGNWRGGQFSVGCRWGGTLLSSFTSNYHSRLFDSWDTRYASNRSHFAFTQNTDTYNASDPATKTENYLFGYSYSNYPQYCYGTMVTNGLGNYVREDSHLNTWRNDAWTMPNYIIVKDYETSYYFIAGVAPAVRGIWVDEIQEGTVITEDGSDWKVFPVRCRKPSGDHASADYGYAYRIS